MNAPALYSQTYVEIDIPICDLTWGVAPCTASGPLKCFNCLSTCQDILNYDETEVTLRFAIATDYLDDEIDAIPVLERVNFSPAIISLGEDLGQRASLSLDFREIRWSDTGVGFDPYYADRAYNPSEQGTFWGKFRARQPYLRGRNLRLIRGLLGQTLEDMETRHFIIESTDGPTVDGTFRIVAKDILKLADGDRAQAPAVSEGALAANITNAAASATLSPTGVGAKYPASGLMALGNNEIVSFTRSGDTLTLTGRGLHGTAAAAHAAQDEAQVVLRYQGANVADIIYDLLVTYAKVPASYIDLPAWQTEVASFNARLYTGTIAIPTSVNKLISELIQQAGLSVWWDDVNKQVRLLVLRTITTNAELFLLDENMLGLTIEEQPQRRLSEVWTHYAQKNPLNGQEDESNYASKEVLIDVSAAQAYGSKAIKKIYSRWIPTGGRTIAARINNILLGRFRDPPRRFSFPVFRYGAASPTLGEGCLLEAFPLQTAAGAIDQIPMQIVRLNPEDTQFSVVADEMRFLATQDDPSIRDIIYDASTNGVNLRTSHDMFYPTPTGGETVNAYIEQTAVLGALASGSAAFSVGTWPSITFSGGRTNASAVVTVANTSAFKVGMAVSGPGFTGYRRILSIITNTSITLDGNASTGGAATLTLWTVIINLTVRGRIQGAGGVGGIGAYFIQGPNVRTTAAAGSAGTLALHTRYPINLILNQGLGRIFGGGGGGGGAGVLALSNHAGGSGGGGSGVPVGLGGPRTTSGSSTSGTANPGTLDAGGQGGNSNASFAWSQSPYMTGVRGGSGGGPGLAGGSGGNHGGNGAEQQVGGGGAAGPSIDGVSYVKKTGTGDLRGGQIN